jgi:hypothetical protein
MTNCIHCGTELIHGGDHDGDDEDEYDMVSNFSCPNCETHVLVYHAYEEKEKDFYTGPGH